MITTVIFDCGEVLIQGMYGVEHQIAALVGRDAKHVWKALNSKPHKNDMFCGRITELQYWEALISANNWTCGPEQLEELIRQNFVEIPDTRAIVEAMRQAGYQLGLLSVHAREWVAYCEATYNYHQHFQVIQYSYEVGLRKPDPAVFLWILDDLKASPWETVFIDDHPRNIEVARGLGTHTVEFVSAEQARHDLITLGINLG